MLRLLGRDLHARVRGRKVLYVGFSYIDEGEISLEVERELDEYLKSERKTFTFEPDFSIYPPKVRDVLRYVYTEIPYGGTATYSDVARKVGTHPRFVGLALSKNRHLILIPCHRVLGKRGLGGYSEGLNVKSFLLSLESRYRI